MRVIISEDLSLLCTVKASHYSATIGDYFPPDVPPSWRAYRDLFYNSLVPVMSGSSGNDTLGLCGRIYFEVSS